MAQIIFMAIAAGAASTLLFASITSGTLMSAPLFNLAPLPILIAGLGWSHLAALIAAAIAATLLGFMFGGLLLLNFLVGVGLPAWWLSYLVLLARPVQNGAGQTVEWYPIGRIVVWIAALSSLVVTIVVFTMASDTEELRAALRKIPEAVTQAMNQRSGDAAARQSAHPILQMISEHPDRILLPAATAASMMTEALVLWLAGRIVRVSGRLKRPWPDLSDMRLPPMALTLLGGAGLAAFLPGLLGVVAIVIASSLLTAFALQGLAVIHALSRRLGARWIILSGIYFGVVVLLWPLLILALLGLVDTQLDLRARAQGAGPPTLPT